MSPTRLPPAISGSVRHRGPPIVATAVAAERADAVPSTFAAVLIATIDWPTSAATSVYWAPVAPGIVRQPPPSQRSHERLYAVSAVASQAKPVAVSVAPCWTAELWMTGTLVLTGGAAATAPVGAAVAEPEPEAFAAVTTTVIVKPTSALVST